MTRSKRLLLSTLLLSLLQIPTIAHGEAPWPETDEMNWFDWRDTSYYDDNYYRDYELDYTDYYDAYNRTIGAGNPEYRSGYYDRSKINKWDYDHYGAYDDDYYWESNDELFGRWFE